jgi:hypothetical protein
VRIAGGGDELLGKVAPGAVFLYELAQIPVKEIASGDADELSW